MAGHDSTDPVWIVTGVPGAGKSTTARALARTAPLAAHVEGDILQRLIVAGNRPPQPEYDEDAERQIRLNVTNQCLLARSYAEQGYRVALDYVVTSRERLRQYVELLQPLPVAFVMLNPGLTVAAERDLVRPHKTVLHDWLQLADEMTGELTGIGMWLDNGGMTVEQTVEHILRHAATATVRLDQMRPGPVRQAQLPELS